MDNLYETDIFEKLPGKAMRPGVDLHFSAQTENISGQKRRIRQ
ncbi:hypothetical protein [Parasporobacterium paucivorans]|nr:hypothetical protein [Parasporobacterium paucivorans]